MENNVNSSLSEVNQTVDVNKKNWLKKLLAFMGPGYLVSVGYMDPGNWATDIAGGSAYGYALIWVLLMSNIMALLLQSLSARLGIVAGYDLAQISRKTYPKFVNVILYFLAEIAIAACDLAEVLGMAIGLNLLFKLPLMAGVAISVLDTFILLFLLNYGIRKMEAFILSLVGTIAISFLFQLIMAKPDMLQIAKGVVPFIPDDKALYIAIGIIGATVMPHNLYLHSSLVQTRRFERTAEGMRKAIRFNNIDSAIALNLAFFVNSSILILAASTFFRHGYTEVAEIQTAHQLLAPLIGSNLAPVLFAVALIAAGQSSTVTGTLAGQIIMEGYLALRIQPWLRRILTRLLAIVPALIVLNVYGEAATGKMLILSQVILSMQLGFAIIPLIHFVSNKDRMGEFVISKKVQLFSWLIAIVIVGLNIKLVYSEIVSLIQNADNSLVVASITIPLAVGGLILLGYIIVQPIINKDSVKKLESLHSDFTPLKITEVPVYNRIAVSVDFSESDSKTIAHAIKLGNKDTEYCLIHIVETAGALVHGNEISDNETKQDIEMLNQYVDKMRQKGIKVSLKLGYGSPKKSIPSASIDFQADLLVMGAHGHTTFKDLIFGTTIDAVRHRLKIPVFVVR